MPRIRPTLNDIDPTVQQQRDAMYEGILRTDPYHQDMAYGGADPDAGYDPIDAAIDVGTMGTPTLGAITLKAFTSRFNKVKWPTQLVEKLVDNLPADSLEHLAPKLPILTARNEGAQVIGEDIARAAKRPIEVTGLGKFDPEPEYRYAIPYYHRPPVPGSPPVDPKFIYPKVLGTMVWQQHARAMPAEMRAGLESAMGKYVNTHTQSTLARKFQARNPEELYMMMSGHLVADRMGLRSKVKDVPLFFKRFMEPILDAQKGNYERLLAEEAKKVVEVPVEDAQKGILGAMGRNLQRQLKGKLSE